MAWGGNSDNISELEEKKKENARGGAGLDFYLVPIEEGGRVGTRGSGQAGPPSIWLPPGFFLASC